MFVFVYVYFHFVHTTVTNFISFFCKRVCFFVSLIFSLDNTGGRAPMVSPFSLVVYRAFLDIFFLFKNLRGVV